MKIWACRVTATTTDMTGRKRTMSRLVDGAGDVVKAMGSALAARKDKGALFSGCEIVAMTPLGQRVVRVLDPDTMTLVE